ncbi:MAG: molecular chaperone DnaJ [Candidatus Goldbacteria bacterium]|nr:molecular chaperone DnaJ [Candidatus Goldiibacteriota bacterium]
MDDDLYKTLGVSKNAGQDEIKSAFRKLAKQYHPDIYQGNKKEAEEKFKKIAEAYEILSDPEKRNTYDTFGYEGMKNRGYSGPGGFEGFGFEDIFSGFSDIFDDIFDFGFGRKRQTRSRMNGEDIKVDLTIDFEETVRETQHQIEITRRETCEVCKGEGIKPGTTKKTCRTCNGNGKIRTSQGFFSVVTTCPDCHGEGRIAEELCRNCNGKKFVTQKRKIDVKIPAGIYDEAYIKLTGLGHCGLGGGMNGDLYVVMHVRPHEFFKREDNDCILFLPITVSQAVLGDKIEIPTLYGNYEIEIKSGTQNNDIITVKGKGFPDVNSGHRGDLKIHLQVEMPKNVDSRLREAFKNVKSFEKEDNYPESKKVMKKLKVEK